MKLLLIMTLFFSLSNVFSTTRQPYEIGFYTDYLNWKTGDSVHYDVYIQNFKMGAYHLEVTRTEGENNFWLETTSSEGLNKTIVLNLVRRMDGKILKTTVNGIETQPMILPKLTISSEEDTTIQVPVGTFECKYRKLKDEVSKVYEFWSNLEDVPMSGILKSHELYTSRQLLLTGYRQSGKTPVGFGYEDHPEYYVDPFIKDLQVSLSGRYLTWKVGEKAHYNLYVSGFQNGTYNMEVKKEEDNNVWLGTVVENGLVKVEVDTLHRRLDGKILKMFINGSEVTAPPPPKLEEIYKEETIITVLAGTFEAVYHKFRDEIGNIYDMWENAEDIPISHLIKSYDVRKDQRLELISYEFP